MLSLIFIIILLVTFTFSDILQNPDPPTFPVPQVLYSKGLVGLHLSMDVSSDGRPVLAFEDATYLVNDLGVIVCSNPECDSQTTTFYSASGSGLAGRYSSTLVRTAYNNRPIISYFDSNTNGIGIANCLNPSCSEAAQFVVSTPSIATFFFTSIVDYPATGYPIISFGESTTPRTLFLGFCSTENCTSFSSQVTLDTTGTGEFNDAFINPTTGFPMVASYDVTSSALVVFSCSNTLCSTSSRNVLDTVGDVGRWPSLAWNPFTNTPIVSYRDSTGSSIKVAFCNDVDCTTANKTTIDNISHDIGWYTRCTVTSTGLIVVPFQDRDLQALKVAWCQQTISNVSFCQYLESWTHALMDSQTGGGGLYPGIRLVDDVPLISYSDYGANDVRITHFLPKENCDPGFYLVNDSYSLHCFPCPLPGNPVGTWNPAPSRSEKCTFEITSKCSKGHFLNSTTDIPFCQSCPQATNGVYNPNPNLSDKCVFTESQDVLVGAVIGLASLSLMSIVSIARYRNLSKRRQVVYVSSKDLGIFQTTRGSMSRTRSSSSLSGNGNRGGNQPNKDFINICSLDGGGIRGLIHVFMLQHLTKKIGIPVSSCFHFICGTSTGGLLALAIRAGLSLDECQNLYEHLGSKIFSKSFSRRFKVVRILKQFLGSSIYNSAKFEDLLIEIFGPDGHLVTDSLPYCVAIATITSVHPPTEFLFRTYSYPPGVEPLFPGSNPDDNWKVYEAARATSAAPIFFSEYSRNHQLYSDGALFHNNPSRVALRESRIIFPDSNLGVLLSLGTGDCKLTIASKKSSFGWAKTMASILTNTDRAHKELQTELDPQNYYRFSPELPYMIPMDASGNYVVELLKSLVIAYIASEDTENQMDSFHLRLWETWKFLTPPLHLPDDSQMNMPLFAPDTAFSSTADLRKLTRPSSPSSPKPSKPQLSPAVLRKRITRLTAENRRLKHRISQLQENH